MRLSSFCRPVLAAVFCLASLGAAAQTCALPGRDGPATPTGVVNTYHGGISASGNTVTVRSRTGERTNARALQVGDLVLIVQMQDSATPANAGLHEYAQVTAISAAAQPVLTLNRTLTNAYAQATASGTVRTFQVVWVPQYSSAVVSGTVSADRWTIATATGSGTGGIVAFDVAGSLVLNGSINVAGAGFRGGAGVQGTGTRAGGTYTDASYAMPLANYNGGLKGEGTAGTPPAVFAGVAAPVDYSALLVQGYPAGAGGRGAVGNAGGGGNDGNPSNANPPGGGSNEYNAGGGGGGNAAAGGNGGNSWNSGGTAALLNQPGGGNTGNAAGGLGGLAQTVGITRLVLGGGGGAGAVNNGTASSVTSWPPTSTSTVANGAAGIITSSGASGGGMVLLRAGTFAAGAGATINASGYRAYNKSPASNSDAAGGGGAGGSVAVQAGAGSSGANLAINASGGAGGSSNYFNHGPGGGGAGGYVLTSFTGHTTNVAGGANGTDACCGGTAGNGSPKAWNSTAGTAGTAAVSAASPTGVNGGASCLPVISVAKTALTPVVTAATGATALYQITVSNTGGGVSNLFVYDTSLPPGWLYMTSPAATYTYAPSPGGAPVIDAADAGAEATSAVLPAGLPVTAATSVNSGSVSLRAQGVAPGTVPAAGANSPTFGSFYLPQGGTVTIAFAASIPDTATAGTYHNPAAAIFLDPTRLAAAANRMVTPLANNAANRAGTSYSNTAYASGATANVGGANHSGLEAGPATDNVALLPDLAISKTSNMATTVAGTTSFQYYLTFRNNGRPVANQVFATTQATGQSATAIVSNPIAITDTLPAGVSLTAVQTSNAGVWNCTSATSSTFTCSASVATPYPLAAASTIVTITATATVSATGCPGPLVNTATVSIAAIGEASTANNTGTTQTAIVCANLGVTKTDGTTTLAAGSTTTYTVTFVNLGPSDASGAMVRDIPSAGLSCTVTGCSSAGGTCPAAPADLLSVPGVALPSLPAASTTTFTVRCGVTASGQ